MRRNLGPVYLRRVVVTGIGAVTPLGLTARTTWQGLIEGRSGIGTIKRFDAVGTKCPVIIAGEVKDYSPTDTLPVALYPRGQKEAPLTAAFSVKEMKKLGRFAHLGTTAALEAYGNSGLDAVRDSLAADRLGVNLGVGLGGLPEIEATHAAWMSQGYRKISPFFILQVAPNLLAGHVSLLLNFQGPNMAIASACATSGHAIGESTAAIARGDADVMIAGGAESTISPLAMGAFAQMKALSTRNEDPAAASRPYDKDRDGFVLSEGAVAFVLEERDHAISRGAHIYAEVSGYGATADAFHYSGLPPAAEGSQRAMRKALATAGLEPGDIGLVSAHATSTPAGDVEEAQAIASVFGGHLASLQITAVKSMTGHLLGGAGAMGAMAAVMALREGIVPPTLNLHEPDEVIAGLGLNLTPGKAMHKKFSHALANSYGFGGTNASLAFSTP